MLEEEYQPRRRLPRHLRPSPPPEPTFSFSVRPATDADLPSIREIYNHYVANSTVTFDEDPQTLKEMRAKFTTVSKLGFPWIVAESPRGEILGYATVTPWKAKAAYYGDGMQSDVFLVSDKRRASDSRLNRLQPMGKKFFHSLALGRNRKASFTVSKGCCQPLRNLLAGLAV